MAPLPKKKTSKSKKGRRTLHLHATTVHLVVCPQCRLPKPSHQVCPSCGHYKGRTAIEVENPASPS
ncbi:MAG: 50S ribosomal protein L32 [Chloroflexi bacterium]|nr:50S ribosomal protein L32 [Chloroflexota bacterium]